MTDDVRISVGLRRHRKTKRLKKLLGADGCWALVCLFLWAGEERWTGDLSGLTDDDIETEADWDGEPGAFVSALTDVGFLVGEARARSIHDWQEHNPYASSKGKRINKGKAGAEAKWGDSQSPNKTRSERLASARGKGTHTAEQWKALVLFHGGRCVLCGTEGVVKDHIVPIYQGGSDSVDNLQPLCRSCNSSKGPDSSDYRKDGWRNACETPANACEYISALQNASPPAPAPAPTPTTQEHKQDQKRAPAAPTPADLFPDVDPDHLRDWVAARKAKRLPLTETAAKGFRRAADKAGMTAAEAVKFCAEKGWAGLYADTQQGGNARAGPQQAQPVGKQMQGLMALEAMKSGNRMAAGRGAERAAEAVLLVAGSDARR